jgi:hypothetical protein
MRYLPLIAALTLAPAAACAATPPASVQKDAQARVEAAAIERLTPEEANDTSIVPAAMKQTTPAMFRKVDINGDGLADWKVDYTEAPNASFFCGSGGCRTDLFVGEPDGTWRRVFSHTVGTMKFTGGKANRGIEINYHGSICDTYGAAECLRAYRWDSKLGLYAETPNSKGLGLLAGGSLPALDVPLPSAPPEVQALIAERAKACEAFGGTYGEDDASFWDIPDFNGDGVRDWLVGSRYDGCDFEDATPEGAPGPRLIFVASRADGTFAPALERAEASWEMDISTAPARIILVLPNDDCGSESRPCPRQPLTWDAASQTLRARE